MTPSKLTFQITYHNYVPVTYVQSISMYTHVIKITYNCTVFIQIKSVLTYFMQIPWMPYWGWSIAIHGNQGELYTHIVNSKECWHLFVPICKPWELHMYITFYDSCDRSTTHDKSFSKCTAGPYIYRWSTSC